MAEETQGDSSTPEVADVEIDSSALESLNSEQRDHWLKTGEIPDTPKADASATSKAPEKAAAVQPEPAPGKEAPQDRDIPPAEKRIKQLLARNKELEAQLHRPTPPPASIRQQEQSAPDLQRPQRPKAPTLDQYDGDYSKFEAAAAKYEEDFDKYMEDLSDYKAAKRIEAERQAYQQRREAETIQEHNAKIKSSWETRQSETIKRHPDFEQAVKEASLPLNPIMDGFIIESEVGPEIVYHLAKNPAEGERIAKLGPFATARELSRIEMQLSESLKPTGANATKITAAKPPPTMLGGTNRAPDDEAQAAVASGEFRRYMKVMNARELGKKG
jgi:hypothetical protein